MIEIDCLQGTAEWHEARMGKPTASQFHRILTPKTRRPAAGAKTYLHELLAEYLLGKPLGEMIGTGFMQRGSEMEADAVRYYEFQREPTREVGFVLLDGWSLPGGDPLGEFDHCFEAVGCSPDRLVGEDGGLEIKCLSAANHVAGLLERPTQYDLQVQGSMWVTGRKWWDLLLYNPELPSIIVRLERDEDLIKALRNAVGQFVENLLKCRERLREYKIQDPMDELFPERVESAAEPVLSEASRPPATGDGIPY